MLAERFRLLETFLIIVKPSLAENVFDQGKRFLVENFVDQEKTFPCGKTLVYGKNSLFKEKSFIMENFPDQEKILALWKTLLINKNFPNQGKFFT